MKYLFDIKSIELGEFVSVEANSMKEAENKIWDKINEMSNVIGTEIFCDVECENEEA